MIVIVNSKTYLYEVTREVLENASMIFLLYADRFDIIKNTFGPVKLNIPIEGLPEYLLAATELEMKHTHV